MILECPHCYRTVSPMRGVECPVCHNNVNKPPRHSLTVIAVSAHSKLPEMCAVCGIHTRRTVRIASSFNYATGRNETSASELAGGWFRLIFGLLMLRPFRAVDGAVTVSGAASGASGSTVDVCVAMRQCRDCARRHAIHIVKVDYDYQNVQIAVNNQFAGAYKEMNAPAVRTTGG